MVLQCYGCNFEFDDESPEKSAKEMLFTETPEFMLKCPVCGSIMVPEHFDNKEIKLLFRRSSSCPNAFTCATETEAYRPECEKLVFYPGCLNFLWREVNLLKKTMQSVHQITDEDVELS